MAARLWIGVLLAELAIASGVAVLCAFAWPLTALVTGAIALAVAPLVYAGVVALSFLAAYRHRGAGDERGSGPWWRALWTELGWFALAQAAMVAAPRRPPDGAPTPARQGPPRPVLLLHGYGCNRGVWTSLWARLRAAGYYPLHAIDLEPLGASIDDHVAAATRALALLHQRSGEARVTIVAHSMGGLIARLLATTQRPLIRRIVTIGTPHHGARLARWLGNPAARQMRPASPWLERLNGELEGRAGVPLTSLYSLQDNIVVPAHSAALRGADSAALHGLGHFGLLGAGRAHDAILAAIAAPGHDA
ncbi:MAG: alpha/beta fold hydrolase [Proteobacteria bacterium]|nr:alpha/beta fold hydrolase [Pseudomonadota bacterium]